MKMILPLVLLGLSLCPLGAAVPGTENPPAPKAPPEAPPPLVRGAAPETPRPRPHGPTPWSIGQPTDEEQLYLEFMNRSRADPPAEGERLATTTDPDVILAYNGFDVDLGLMRSQFDAIAAAPPLAMNAQLTAAARLHSGDMYTNVFQGHTGSGGSTIGQRVTAQGYNWMTVAENVFSFAESVWHGHAGFNADWGGGPETGGIQSPPGHRIAIANAAYREVGVGVVLGTRTRTNTTVGPQLVTQNFGTRQGATPLITGVAYHDLDGDDFYGVGEGLGGITVEVIGSDFHSVTAVSGGYAVPVPGNGNYTVTFTGPNLAVTQQVTVASLRNVKADLVPAYVPPAVTGPDPTALNHPNPFTVGVVAGATAYAWSSFRLAQHTATEGAENGLENVTVDSSGNYDVVTSDVKASGENSFHLAHPAPPRDQSVTLNDELLLGTSSELRFAERLGWSASGQTARAQISTDGGASWQNLWSLTGTNGPGQTAFLRVTNSLAAFAGQTARFRFLYAFAGGSYYSQTNTSNAVGFFVDDIEVTDATRPTEGRTNTIASGRNFSFTPEVEGSYLLRARAFVGERARPWGPAVVVTASASAGAMPAIAAGPTNRVEPWDGAAQFSVMASGTPPLSYQWFKDDAPLADATFELLSLAQLRRSHAGSYRVVVSNALGRATSGPATLRLVVTQALANVSGDVSRTVLHFRDADGSALSAADAPWFEVQATTNLVPAQWVTLPGGLAATNGFLRFLDDDAARPATRFYRVLAK